MNKYDDISNLFRDNLKDYAPEPSPHVWQDIASYMQRPRINFKHIVFATAVFMSISAIVLGIIYLMPQKEEPSIAQVDTLKDNTQLLQKQKQPNENNPNTFIQPFTPATNNNYKENHTPISPAEPITTISPTERDEVKPVQKNKTQSLRNNKINPVTPAFEEQLATQLNHPKENIPAETVVAYEPEKPSSQQAKVYVSKDTMICENSTIKLSALNATNVRWNNGRNTSTIEVNISNSEMFSVSYTDPNGKDTLVHIFVRVVPCSKLTIPTAFTPNGDGLNDVFSVFVYGEISNFEMYIYSMNQRLLFRTTSVRQAWDGTFKGVLQNHGPYYYIIRYKDNFNQSIERKGEFLLIRN